MPILYSVISRGTTVLARYANNCTGNFSEITEQVLAQIGLDDSKMTYSHGSFLFHYILQDRIIYLCISDDVYQILSIFYGPFKIEIFAFRNLNDQEHFYF